MRQSIWGLVVVLACFSCSNLEKVKGTDEFGNIEEYHRDKETFAKEGWYFRTEPGGGLIEASHYENDTLHGQRILFYENGDTSIVEQYSKGRFDGPYRMYFENKQLQQSGQYVNNQMEGAWSTYYENGQLREKVHFVAGDENGAFIEYHESGTLKAQGSYKDGDYEHGELKLYDEDGELLRKMMCNIGRCTTTWVREGVEE